MSEYLFALFSQAFLPQTLLPHFPLDTGVEEDGCNKQEEDDAENKLVNVLNQIKVTSQSFKLMLTPPAADIR